MSPAAPISVQHGCVLVVEGTDDQRFFESFILDLGLTGIQVLSANGKDNIRATLKALVRTPPFAQIVTSVAVARDADEDGNAAFQSVCDALSAAGLAVPGVACERTATIPSVSVLILPDCTEGALEHLCLRSVVDDPAMPCVEAFFTCVRNSGCSVRNPAKAKVQAFLASRTEEGKRLGEAAQAGYWPWGSPAFDRVRDFLQQITP